MPKPNIKYQVTLTAEERAFLQNPVKKGKMAGHRIRHAQILLALDEAPQNRHWTDAKIGPSAARASGTAGALRKCFVEEGFDAALGRKKREVPMEQNGAFAGSGLNLLQPYQNRLRTLVKRCVSLCNQQVSPITHSL